MHNTESISAMEANASIQSRWGRAGDHSAGRADEVVRTGGKAADGGVRKDGVWPRATDGVKLIFPATPAVLSNCQHTNDMLHHRINK
jgi:hypothetical protein